MVPRAVAGSPSAAAEHHPGSRRALLLAALGMVYGDIGTSPRHTFKETFGHAGGLAPHPARRARARLLAAAPGPANSFAPP
jgi:hypothetical protein